MDHQPAISSGPPGNRTPIAWVQTKRLPFGPAARVKRSVAELNRVFLLTTEVCCQNTYRPFRVSDPGWNRTSTFLVVTQASSPLDHGIVILPVTEVGLEPTGTRLSTSPLCQFAYPVVSGGSGSCTPRSRLMRPGGACAHPRHFIVAGPGIEPGAPALWEPVGHLPRLQCVSDQGEI